MHPQFSFLFLASAIYASSITVPGAGVAGQCSPSPVTQASYNATIVAPGITGVYLLPQSEYNKLVQASQAPSQTPVQFNYYIDYSCTGGNITTCNKSSGNNPLTSEVTCVALVNAASNNSVSADLSISFGGASPTSAASNVGVGGWGVAVAATLGSLFML